MQRNNRKRNRTVEQRALKNLRELLANVDGKRLRITYSRCDEGGFWARFVTKHGGLIAVTGKTKAQAAQRLVTELIRLGELKE